MINTDILQQAVNNDFQLDSYTIPYDGYIDHEYPYDNEVDCHLVIYRNLTGEKD